MQITITLLRSEHGYGFTAPNASEDGQGDVFGWVDNLDTLTDEIKNYILTRYPFNQ